MGVHAHCDPPNVPHQRYRSNQPGAVQIETESGSFGPVGSIAHSKTTEALDRSGASLVVGIGVDPSMISFGTMINNARMELGREPVVWWSLAAAFAAMFILVLAANLFADAVRDAFDPRAA